MKSGAKSRPPWNAASFGAGGLKLLSKSAWEGYLTTILMGCESWSVVMK